MDGTLLMPLPGNSAISAMLMLFNFTRAKDADGNEIDIGRAGLRCTLAKSITLMATLLTQAAIFRSHSR